MGNKLVHWEIPVLDTNKAKEFYGKVFDWKFQSWGDAGDYTLFVAAEDNGGALMKVDKMPAEPGIRVYIDVADMPATLEEGSWNSAARSARPRPKSAAVWALPGRSSTRGAVSSGFGPRHRSRDTRRSRPLDSGRFCVKIGHD